MKYFIALSLPQLAINFQKVGKLNTELASSAGGAEWRRFEKNFGTNRRISCYIRVGGDAVRIDIYDVENLTDEDSNSFLLEVFEDKNLMKGMNPVTIKTGKKFPRHVFLSGQIKNIPSLRFNMQKFGYNSKTYDKESIQRYSVKAEFYAYEIKEELINPVKSGRLPITLNFNFQNTRLIPVQATIDFKVSSDMETVTVMGVTISPNSNLIQLHQVGAPALIELLKNLTSNGWITTGRLVNDGMANFYLPHLIVLMNDLGKTGIFAQVLGQLKYSQFRQTSSKEIVYVLN